MYLPGDHAEHSGPFDELLRLQTQFQTRLAEETMRYLRLIQGALLPATPGTVVRPDGELKLEGAAPRGGRVELAITVENRQRVFCMLTPELTPLADGSGTVWYPQTEPCSMLVPPDETRELVLALAIPAEIPYGTYRGGLLLPGYRAAAVPVAIDVKRIRAPKGAATVRNAKSAKKATGARARERTR